MIRNLYRAYLYIVCITLLIVVSIAVAGLLNVLLSQTDWRGQYGVIPDRSQVVQAVTFAIVAFIVAGLIGGLHYWLLRRDLRADPGAGGGGVRAFFLDFSAAISALIAIAMIANVVTQLANPNANEASSVAAALATAGFYAVVELERRRALATTRAALAFQRLHLYGVPLVTVLIAASFWNEAVRASLDAIFLQRGMVTQCSQFIYTPDCISAATTANSIVAQWIAVLFLVAAWLAYVWLARGDGRSAIRQVFHLGGLAVGLIFALGGGERAFELGFRKFFSFSVSWFQIVEGSYSFVGPLLFGLLVFAAYFILYRREAEQLPTGPVVGVLTLRAVTGLIFAVPFFTGCGLVLQYIVQNAIPAGSQPGLEHLATALAYLIIGLGYPPLAIALARGSTAPEHSGPRRAFVLFLLTGGTITAAVGLVIALRAIVTAALGAPIDHWESTAIDGVVTLVIGGIIAGLYGWFAAREHVFNLPASHAPAPPAPESTATVESVLDELLAGKLTRDEAAAQIRQLARSGR